MLVQPSAKLVNSFGPNRDAGRMRVTAKLFKQIATRSQSIQQVIGLDTSSRAVSQTALNREHDTRSIYPLCDLRSGDSDDTAVPPFTPDYPDVGILRLF